MEIVAVVVGLLLLCVIIGKREKGGCLWLIAVPLLALFAGCVLAQV